MDEGERENQQLQPSRNEPPTEPPPALPESGEESDSNMELWREAERLEMMTEVEKTEWKSAQCRSRSEVPFTRRKIQVLSGPRRHMGFTHWQIEVRKPEELARAQTLIELNKAREGINTVPLDTAGFEELWQQERRLNGLPELTSKEMKEKWSNCSVRGLLEVKRMFETDVEAEVAGTVLSLLYDDYAKLVRDNSYENHRTKIRFHGCRWLIDQVMQDAGHPDIMDNANVKDFVYLCCKEFKRIADDKKLRGIECPEELGAVVEEYIHNAMKYTKPYPLDKLPPSKLTYKHGKKRKDSSWLELDCCCNVHKKIKCIKWPVPMDLCLCHGLNYRLTYAGDDPLPRKRRRYRRRNQTLTVSETRH